MPRRNQEGRQWQKNKTSFSIAGLKRPAIAAAPNTIIHGLEDPNGNEIRGPEEFKKFHHSFRSAFPDIHISIEEMVLEGDLVVGYCKIKATDMGAGWEGGGGLERF